MSPWIDILVGVIASGLVLWIYFAFLYGIIYKRLGTLRSMRRRLWVALLVVLAYAGHAILFIQGDHLKDSTVRSEYRSLHPILRLAVSTWIHVDEGLIVTDAARSIEDYDRMGLARHARSLHLPQGDGRVYAVDLRTLGRSEFLNQLVRLYFRAMGFQTLRHVGTADHLHVALTPS